MSLFQCWKLENGGTEVPVSSRQQRLIAALAISGPAPRHYLCGLLWPESPDSRALENLRVSIHHVSRDLPGLLVNGGRILALGDGVSVDLKELRSEMTRADRGLEAVEELAARLRQAELLPGWYDDWVILEQRRLLQARVTLLERLADGYLRRGEPFRAIDAANFALSLEPVNESALALLVRAHMTAGNRGSALQVAEEFTATLRRELGIQPSSEIAGMLRSIRFA